MSWPPQPERRYLPHEHPPHVRATDDQREQVAEKVRGALSDGRLTIAELDERLNAVYTARTHGELHQTIADLYDSRPPPSPPVAPPMSMVPHPGYYPPVPADTSEKMVLPTFLMCLFLGPLGVHRFYVGKPGSAVAMLLSTLFTFGIVGGIWTIVDLIIIAVGSFRDGENRLIRRWT